MKTTLRSATVLLGLFALAAPAAALSIANGDEGSYKVTVTAGENITELTADAGATVEAACGEACIVALHNAEGIVDELDAVEADKFTITGGVLQRAE